MDELAGSQPAANVYLGPRTISLLDSRLANRGRRTERLYLVRFVGCAAYRGAGRTVPAFAYWLSSAPVSACAGRCNCGLRGDWWGELAS